MLARIRLHAAAYRVPCAIPPEWASAIVVRPTADNGAFFGAVCPGRGATAALVMPHADMQALNARLAPRTVAEGAHAVLVPDSADWQGGKALHVPDKITLLPLPPYAPEPNPIKNVRPCLRANRLAITVLETCEDIVAQCCDARNIFANGIATARSVTNRDYGRTESAQGFLV